MKDAQMKKPEIEYLAFPSSSRKESPFRKVDFTIRYLVRVVKGGVAQGKGRLSQASPCPKFSVPRQGFEPWTLPLRKGRSIH